MIDKPTNEAIVSQLLENMDAGALMTKFLVIMEGIDNDGERAIYMTTNDGAQTWDNIGMLEYALAREKHASQGEE